MEKNYDHKKSEDKIYASWENSGAMKADNKSKKKKFTIPLPPPNVTGELHLGHAAMLAIEDIMIRFKKMTGHEALWVPGTDHAAIATENVVLKHLGIKSREEMKREEFLEECRKFATEKHDRIEHQIKKMGAWLDWSREAYTFDEPRNHAVNTIFKRLYDDGLISRGHRMINWSVGAQSVLSDEEVEWEENETDFYEFWCGPFIVGTVRMETKCADSPVVVHPKAKYIRAKNSKGRECIVTKKYWNGHTQLRKDFEVQETVPGKDLIGMKFEAETYAGKRKFHVMADKVIDPDFGTGAMTISTAHSPEDFELAQKYHLPLIQKIDFKGKMTEISGPCKGMKVLDARKKAGEIIEEKDLLFSKRNYSNRVPKCYRSGTVVEPMISPQWFILVDKEFKDQWTGKKTTLKKLTAEAVRSGDVKIIPKQFEKVYFHWIDNLRDWCISRQIWWGHRIPVWYDEKKEVHLPNEQKVVFARHGEKEWDESAQKFVLSAEGKKQAITMSKKLKDKNISLIIASPMARAQETAEIVSKELGIPFQTDEIFREIDAPHDAGRDGEEVCTIKTFPKISEESFKEVQKRAIKSWGEIKKIETKGDILIIGHSFFTSMILAVREDVLEEKTFWEKREVLRCHTNCEIKELSFLVPPKGKNLHQDEDTLDTWFSSALWPFSILGWPNEKAEDLQKFFPTDVLETGHDILFFWVARMIMFSKYATGKSPFHTVYLHGLVTDEHGKKMSKSAGNGIDPISVIDKFGADAVRLSLVVGTATGQPIPIGESKISGYRNFVNKLWNAGRFVKMQTPTDKKPIPESLADKWIASKFTKISKEIKKHLDKYEISLAGDKIYHFVWDDFCDWYIEASKKEPNPNFLYHLFQEILKLAHPLCPFITEKLWQELGSKSTLMEECFPESNYKDKEAEDLFEKFQADITEKRKSQADEKASQKEKAKLEKDIPALEARLKNKGYLQKAPAKLVAQTKKELSDAKARLKKLR